MKGNHIPIETDKWILQGIICKNRIHIRGKGGMNKLNLGFASWLVKSRSQTQQQT